MLVFRVCSDLINKLEADLEGACYDAPADLMGTSPDMSPKLVAALCFLNSSIIWLLSRSLTMPENNKS